MSPIHLFSLIALVSAALFYMGIGAGSVNLGRQKNQQPAGKDLQPFCIG